MLELIVNRLKKSGLHGYVRTSGWWEGNVELHLPYPDKDRGWSSACKKASMALYNAGLPLLASELGDGWNIPLDDGCPGKIIVWVPYGTELKRIMDEYLSFHCP